MQPFVLIILSSLLLLLLFGHDVDGAVINNNNNKKLFNSINQQQDLQTLLSSIEERLLNFDQIYSMQLLMKNIDGKLENLLRKLNGLEMKLERVEMRFANDIDKVSMNISNKMYKDELIKEHVLRKLTDVHDRLYHKLMYTELKIEMNDKKIEDKLKLISKELHKNNENVLTGLMDTETELEDALNGIDEIRDSQLKSEDYIRNATRSTTNVYKEIHRDVHVQNENLLKIIEELNVTQLNHLAESRAKIELKFANLHQKFIDSDDTLNNYFNKLTNMNEETLNKNVMIVDNLKTIGRILNETRNEQKNGLRTLTVNFGRLNNKKNNTNQFDDDDDDGIHKIDNKLTTMRKTIDENFENLIATQNMFLESVYRVQMDESQLEVKISMVLQKLIDTFEEKTTCDPKNLQLIEQMLKAHDTSVNRNLYNVLNHTNTLLNGNNSKMLKGVDELEGMYENDRRRVEDVNGESIENDVEEERSEEVTTEFNSVTTVRIEDEIEEDDEDNDAIEHVFLWW